MRTPNPKYNRGLKIVFSVKEDGIYYTLFAEEMHKPKPLFVESGKYEDNADEIFKRNEDLMIPIPDQSQPFDPKVMIEKERLN